MSENLLDGRDIIDTRDIIDRIDELEAEATTYSDDDDAVGTIHIDTLDEYDRAEYDALKAFAEEGGPNFPDFEHGETLISDAHFETYARELAEEIGAIPAAWPARHIDWEAAATALQQDYTAVELDGVTYWGRS